MQRRNWLKVLPAYHGCRRGLAIILWLLSTAAWARPPILFLAPTDEHIELANFASLYQADSFDISIHEVRALDDSEWQFAAGVAPNLGFSDKTLWLKMIVYYESYDERDWVLSIENPNLSKMEMYQVKHGHVMERWEFGVGKQFTSRPIMNRNYAVPLRFTPQQRVEIYLKIYTDGAMQVPLSLSMNESFMLQNERTILLLGLIFGALMMMVLYGILFHIALREPLHLYYAWFVGSMTFFHISLYGIGYQFIWPNAPEFQRYSLMLALVTACFSVISFSRQIIDFNMPRFQWYSHLNRLTKIMLAGAIFLLPFLPKYELLRWMVIWAGVLSFIGIFVAFHAVLLRAKLAVAYFFGFFAFFGGAILLAFSKAGFVAHSALSDYSLLAGTLISSVVLLLVVRQRFREQNDRKLIMQKEALSTEKNARKLQSRYSEMLEQRVKERTEELEEALDELAKANEDTELAIINKTKFLAAASHDIRQPMNALYFYLNSLEQAQGIEPQVLSGVQECIDNLNELFHALFDISKFDTQSWQVKRQHVDLAKIFEQIALEFQNQLNVMLYFEPRHPVVIADPVLLQRSLRILVANAILHAGASQVLVHTRRRHNDVRIEVRDNGIGIPASKQEAIFTEFVQLSYDVHHRKRGLGLGLSLFKRMCLVMGSEFGVRSQVGRGSVFWFDVPVGDKAKVVKVDKEEASNDRSLEKLRVLYVEDDHRVRQAVIPLLQSWGCEVLMAADSSGVIRLVENKQNEPDLILSDFGLPGNINGLQVIAMVRKYFGRKIPALLVSGDMQLTSGDTYGVPLLQKPIRPARLREAFIQLLNTFPPEPPK